MIWEVGGQRLNIALSFTDTHPGLAAKLSGAETTNQLNRSVYIGWKQSTSSALIN